jgi:kynurenine formamidase
MELIDLSQEIYQGMPVYPGHLKTVIWTHATHEETARSFEGGFSFVSSGLLMSDHGPTHVDAIAHLDPRDGAPTVDVMPLDTFYGPATCVDVSHKAPHEYVSGAEMSAAEEAAGVPVEPGMILLIRTGAVDRLGGRAEYTNQYPGLDESAADWLRDRGVKAFGVDSPSPDNPVSKTYPVHMMCRAEGLTHFENLANLGRVVGRRFVFIGFPLRIRAGTGSPVRAVGVLDDA